MGVIAFNASVKCEMFEIEQLGPEKAAAFLDGVARVLIAANHQTLFNVPSCFPDGSPYEVAEDTDEAKP